MSIRWKQGLVAGAVIASLATPAVAYAAPAAPAPKQAPKQTATITQERLQNLRDRIIKVLERRRARFEKAATRIGKHIARLGVLADKVEAKGGNVADVRAMLDHAKTSLDEAKATEAEAVEAFKAVPGSPDPKAAFQEAREIAQDAVEQLKDARSWTIKAAEKLKQTVKQLRRSSKGAGKV